MISPIAQRIGEFIAYKKISRRTFASKLGYVSSEKINRLFRKDGAKPGFDIVADIANKFVEMNVDWLITGRGEMLKSGGSDHQSREAQPSIPGGREDIKGILEAIYRIELQVSGMDERLKQMGI
jgi:hypothetical protein